MLTIYKITDYKQFMNTIQRCSGEVMMHLSHDKKVNLKKDENAMGMIEVMKPRENGILLSVTNKEDVSILVNYMVQS